MRREDVADSCVRTCIAMIRSRRVLFATLIVGGCIAVPAGIAFGWFGATGSGTGSASTATLHTVVTSAAVVAPTTPLLPGTSSDVTLTVSNPNDYPMVLTRVVATPSTTISVSGDIACTPANAGVSFYDQTTIGIVLAAHVVDQPVHLADAITMLATSPTACQGRSFSIPVTITAQS